MARADSVTTGVDQLIALIANKKKISVKEAAKKLQMSRSIIDEWATLLEDSGFIKIEYGISNVFLMRRTLNEKEAKKQASQLKIDKNAFDAASEGLVTYLDRFELQITDLKKLIDDTKLKKMIPKELQKLKKMQKDRDEVDLTMIDARQSLMMKVRKLNHHLQDDQKEVNTAIDKMSNELVGASHIIDLENREMHMIERNEKILNKKLTKLTKLLDRKCARLIRRKKTLVGQEKAAAQTLINHSVSLKHELLHDKKRFIALMKESKKRTTDLEKIHKEIINKIRKQQGQLYGKTPKQIKNLLEKRVQVADMMSTLHHEEQMLKEKLLGFMGRSKSTKPGSATFDSKIKKLNEEFELISKRRDYLEKNLKQIADKLK